MDDTASEKERAILIGVEMPDSRWTAETTLYELGQLAHTAGVEVVGRLTQRMRSPNPATFIGSGKAEELLQLTSSSDANIVIFDDELTPSQQSNLEKILGEHIKVIDRTALILDIFALHAKSREGRLQVKLAQNIYLYPRLRGMWAHLAANRMGGGVGSRFGEGESQLEVDRRMIRKKITSIRKELKDLESVRGLQRDSRNKSGVFKVSLAGYTNAGKSSLLNRLCGTEAYADDLLFATLDSTTRKLILPEGRQITITDTVGFIQKLPTTLIEAFKSTLDDIAESDLILHVIDATSNDLDMHIDAVYEVFSQLHVESIASILVFNKVDELDSEFLEALRLRFPESVFVSAITGYGIDDLIERISLSAASNEILYQLLIPFERGDLISIAHKKCSIIAEDYTEAGYSLTLRVPKDIESKFSEYSITNA